MYNVNRSSNKMLRSLPEKRAVNYIGDEPEKLPIVLVK